MSMISMRMMNFSPDDVSKYAQHERGISGYRCDLFDDQKVSQLGIDYWPAGNQSPQRHCPNVRPWSGSLSVSHDRKGERVWDNS
jgi:hypothetical protein